MGVSNNPFTIKGRMHRVPYVCTIIIITLIGIVLNALLWDVFDNFMLGAYVTFDVIAGIIIVILDLWMLEIYFAVTIKRLLDIRASGWWCLLNFIPIVDVILFLVLAFYPSRHHEDDLKKATVTQPFNISQPQPVSPPIQPLVTPQNSQQPSNPQS